MAPNRHLVGKRMRRVVRREIIEQVALAFKAHGQA
jgi:uncharacterized protein YqfA (UPF0365 family)